MRIQSRALGVFVPGLYAVPEMPILGTDWPPVTWGAGPAGPITPGLAEFVAAKYAVPQNPVTDAGLGRLGDLVGTEALYPILPNTITAAAQAAGLSGFGLGAGADCGCGCQGHGGCGGGMSGVGDLSTFFSTQWAAIQAGDVKTIALWAGGALLAGWVLFSGTKRRR